MNSRIAPPHRRELRIHRRIPSAFAVSLLAALAACNDATGPEPPDLRGSYDAVFTMVMTEPVTEDVVVRTCASTAEVTSQTRGDFAGTFSVLVNTECGMLTGTFAGEVLADGDINITIAMEGVDPIAALTGCEATASPERYLGVVSNREITTFAEAAVLCFPDTGGFVTYDVQVQFQLTPVE